MSWDKLFSFQFFFNTVFTAQSYPWDILAYLHVNWCNDSPASVKIHLPMDIHRCQKNAVLTQLRCHSIVGATPLMESKTWRCHDFCTCLWSYNSILSFYWLLLWPFSTNLWPVCFFQQELYFIHQYYIWSIEAISPNITSYCGCISLSCLYLSPLMLQNFDMCLCYQQWAQS